MAKQPVFVDGQIEFIIKAGFDIVKNNMPEEPAKNLLAKAKESDEFPGYGLFVDRMYFKTEDVDDEPVKKSKKGE